MSISQDPDVFKILIGIIAGLLGLLEFISLRYLGSLKETDREIFGRLRSIETSLTKLITEHKMRHGIKDE